MNHLQQLSGRGEWPCPAQVRKPAGNKRPVGQLALSLVSMVFSLLIGLALAFESTSGLFCSTIAQPSGANIAAGAALVLLSGLAAIVLAIIVRNHARLLCGVLLGESAMVGLAIGLVGRDSATSRTREDCGFFTDSVSTSTHHVQYAYTLLGLVIAILLTQAFRGWNWTPRQTAGAIAGVASVALLAAVVPGHAGSKIAALGPPDGVLVCRAVPAPHSADGARCDPKADVGRAPIRPQHGLMCWALLHAVRGKRIGIQVFYRGRLIRHADLHSSESETSPYVYFDRSFVHGAATGSQLPAGPYRCRFLVNDTVVRARAITVARAGHDADQK